MPYFFRIIISSAIALTTSIIGCPSPAQSRTMPNVTMTATKAATYASLLPKSARASFRPGHKAQFYVITASGQPVGYLYSEGALWLGVKMLPCFLTWLNPSSGQTRTLQTIGAENYDMEKCDGLKTIGILDSQNTQKITFGAVYSAASPNTDLQEPLVITADPATGAMDISFDDSVKASNVGATTIAAMRKVFRHHS